MTKVLELTLLGRFQLVIDGRPSHGLTSGKAQALLAYLAVSGRPHSRQALAGLLWPQIPEADARRNLRGDLMKLRRLLAPYLLITHQTLSFNRQSAYRLDVEEFLSLLDRQPEVSRPPETVRRAVALYQGDFLEDFHVRHAPAFEEWAAAQRMRLQELMLDACLSLSTHYAEQADYERGIEYSRRLLRIDPVREEAWQQLIRLLALNGQRNVALTQYEILCRTLMDELGVEPSPETVVLVEDVRSGQLKTVPKRSPGIAKDAGHRVVHRTKPGAAARLFESGLPPFVVGPPVTHPRQFFGRERELKRLFNMFKRLPLQNAAVVGPRRSGKTSLLHYLTSITTAPASQLRPGQRSNWLPHPETYRWIFVDFQDPRLGGIEPLLRHLLLHLGLPVPDSCDLENFLDLVGEGLHTPTVILFDEIGVALERYPELDDTFWDSLRSLATNQVDGNLGFVLAGAESPVQLAQQGGMGSPFFNILGYTALLGSLSEPEARELVSSSPLPFSEPDVEWILEQSNRWPILLQVLSRERLLALEEGETGSGWRDDALRQMLPFKRMLDQNET
jgi:DNA-binding SARP family transcriptional activator